MSLQSLVGALSLSGKLDPRGRPAPSNAAAPSAGGPSGLISQEGFPLRLTAELALLPGA